MLHQQFQKSFSRWQHVMHEDRQPLTYCTNRYGIILYVYCMQMCTSRHRHEHILYSACTVNCYSNSHSSIMNWQATVMGVKWMFNSQSNISEPFKNKQWNNGEIEPNPIFCSLFQMDRHEYKYAYNILIAIWMPRLWFHELSRYHVKEFETCLC